MNKKNIQRIIPLFRRYNVYKAGLFGSHARGEQHMRSDIDIAVRMRPGYSLVDFSALKRELSDTLNAPVDLVSFSAINKRLKPHILKDIVMIYEK